MAQWSSGKKLDDGQAVPAEETDTTLRASANMRLAVASNDFSGAGEAWGTVSPALAKIAE